MIERGKSFRGAGQLPAFRDFAYSSDPVKKINHRMSHLS
jgi:hypothetical protein